MALANGFDFGPDERETSLQRAEDVVIMPGLPVDRDGLFSQRFSSRNRPLHNLRLLRLSIALKEVDGGEELDIALRLQVFRSERDRQVRL